MAGQEAEGATSVKQITDVYANWSSPQDFGHGQFRYRLVLDDGAAEVFIRPTAAEAKVLRDLIHDADAPCWDANEEAIVFGKMS